MATVNKNFRIKHGLVVEGSSGTIDGHNILTESTSGNQYILNLVGGATLVKSVDTDVFNVDGSGNLTINAETFDSYGSAAAAQAAAEATASADATTKANAAQAAAEATASADATTKANAAQAAAEATASADATTKANAAQAAAEATASADATTKANAAQSAAEGYADSLINDSATTTTNTWSAYKTSSEIGVAVSNLVDSAPELLDTLNELAAAIADNPNYATDMASQLAAKQNNLTAGTGITIADDEISVTANTYDAYGAAAAAQAAAEATASADATTKANAAQAAAEATASADATTKANAAQAAAEATASADATTKANAAQAAAEATASADATTKANAAQAAAEATASADATTKANAAQAAAEATAQAALDDVLDSSTPFESMNINDVAKQVAARTTSLGSVVVTAYQFNKSAFKSGKFLVKIDNGTHNEISEILVTLDSGDNVAITEYAIVGTNGTRGTITADIENSHCRIRVNPVNDSTITVFGTIFNS